MIVTRTGAELGVASAILACVGIAAGYPELVLVAAAGAAALVTAAGWAAFARPWLVVSRSFMPDQPRAGQTVTVHLLVTNRGSRRSSALSAVEEVGDCAYQVGIPPIRAGKRGEVTYRIPAVRRGRLRVEQARLGCQDPLGLAGTSMVAGERSEVRVHPDWHPEIGPLPAQDLDHGVAETGLPRGDVVFHSLRDYRAGDPPRMIHWRVTARRGGWPVVREQTDPEEPVQVLVLDTSADAYGADAFEEAVRIVASLGMAASRQGLGLELRTTGDGELLVTEPAERRDGDPSAVLDPLCDVRQSRPASGLAEVLDNLAGAMPGRYGSAVLGVVAGGTAEKATAALARARRVFDAVYLIQVGAGPPPASLDGIVHVIVDTCEQFAAEGWRL